MAKCSCGCEEFYAHQIVRMDVIVDAEGNFIESVNKNVLSDIYDAETPYGPYTCRRCGKEYDELPSGPKKTRLIKANEAPAVRALEPARWLINSDGYYPYCSRCGKEPEDGNMTSTCPHCRANMR